MADNVFTDEGEIEMTERLLGTVTFTWSVYINKSLSREEKFWESPLFWFKDSTGVKHEWKLIFCDVYHRRKRYSMGYDTLTLKYLGTGEAKSATFATKFRVLEQCDVSRCKRLCHDDTIDANVSRNFSKSCTNSIILTNLSSYIFDLKITCIIIDTRTDIGEDLNSVRQQEMFLKNEYELLFGSGKFSDITFIVEKHELKLHKSILSSRSPVFAAMFDNDFKENVSNEVCVEDQSYEVMKEFFRFVYAAKVNDLDSNAKEMLILSNKYMISGLKYLCEQTLVKTLQNENAFELLNLANLHNAKHLTAKCIEFIMSNRKQIVELPEFDLSKLPSNLINKLFKLVVEKS